MQIKTTIWFERVFSLYKNVIHSVVRYGTKKLWSECQKWLENAGYLKPAVVVVVVVIVHKFFLHLCGGASGRVVLGGEEVVWR